jgi:hypothetical protein
MCWGLGLGQVLTLEFSADGGSNWYVLEKIETIQSLVVGGYTFYDSIKDSIFQNKDNGNIVDPAIGCVVGSFDMTPWAGESILVRVRVDNVGYDTNNDGVPDTWYDGWVCVNDFEIWGKSDYKAPTATISLSGSLIGHGLYAGPVTVTIQGFDDNAVGAIHYILDGTKTVVSGAKATFKVSADGDHTVEYWAVDASGNEGPHGTISFSIDGTAPTVAITAPTAGLYLFGNKLLSMSKPIIIGAFNIEATASDAQGVYVVKFLLDGSVISEDTTAPYSAYCAVKHMGAGTIKVIAEDGVGNTAEDTLDITYFKFL